MKFLILSQNKTIGFFDSLFIYLNYIKQEPNIIASNIYNTIIIKYPLPQVFPQAMINTSFFFIKL